MNDLQLTPTERDHAARIADRLRAALCDAIETTGAESGQPVGPVAALVGIQIVHTALLGAVEATTTSAPSTSVTH